jgi:hypothetical protein
VEPHPANVLAKVVAKINPGSSFLTTCTICLLKRPAVCCKPRLRKEHPRAVAGGARSGNRH